MLHQVCQTIVKGIIHSLSESRSGLTFTMSSVRSFCVSLRNPLEFKEISLGTVEVYDVLQIDLLVPSVKTADINKSKSSPWIQFWFDITEGEKSLDISYPLLECLLTGMRTWNEQETIDVIVLIEHPVELSIRSEWRLINVIESAFSWSGSWLLGNHLSITVETASPNNCLKELCQCYSVKSSWTFKFAVQNFAASIVRLFKSLPKCEWFTSSRKTHRTNSIWF